MFDFWGTRNEVRHLDLLDFCRYCRTRVLANSVYNNVVCDRHHIHMNSTIWVTLSEFVQVKARHFSFLLQRSS